MNEHKLNILVHKSIILERKTNMLDLNANHIEPKPGMLDRERDSIGLG